MLGPWFVTADEIPNPRRRAAADLRQRREEAGEQHQHPDLRLPQLIEFASTFYTLYPGDVLFTGTPEGVSPVKPGDTMRAVIDPIGEMSIPVRGHKVG